jgi:thioredoxin 1
MRAIAIAGAILIAQVSALAQNPFAPLEAWKSAVIQGDRAALESLYSIHPEAVTKAGKNRIAVKEESAFWAGLKAKGMTEFHPRLLEFTPAQDKTKKDRTKLVLRVSITSGGSHLVAAEHQEWALDHGAWKIIASSRSDAFVDEAKRTLPQPAAPNVALYSDPREAKTELKAALAKAGQEGKRVLVVFGGNWCYDCHVLDTTFHSEAFASLVDANFVVVHINVGDEGKDNNDLAARLGLALDKGVPSLGVLDPSGKVVYAQKDGQFEATEKIGPADVRAFLEKWKPHHS